MSPIRTAILGYGLAGQAFHAPLIGSDTRFEVSAIVTSNRERAALATERHPSALIADKVEGVFSRAEDFDLVVVATPNDSHASLALAAIDAGLHVVIDKPMAITSADARRVYDAARAAGVLLTVFQNRRWDGDFLTVRELIHAGELGEVRQFESAFERWSPETGSNWRDLTSPTRGGGLTYDLSSHLIDQAVQLFGPVLDLHAELDFRRPGTIGDDDSFLSLRHLSGVRSRLWVSAVSPAPRPRFRVIGSTGALETTGLDPQEPQLISGLRPGDTGYGLASNATATLTRPEQTTRISLLPGRYQDFYRGLAESVLSDTPLPVDPRDSIATLELIEAAVKSS